jgi:UDP-N-acetylglucosamine 4,6-dehydratase
MKEAILVTGGTGFLGKTLVRSLVNQGHSVVVTGYSESGIKNFEREFGINENIKLYSLDITGGYLPLKRIIQKHSVTHIIHAAALKHVGICEDNPTRAIEVNVNGSRNVIDAAISENVKNVIAISTDKAVKPLCVYGMTKKLMEEIFIENGFSVFRGVNFLFSSESVLDIWDKLRVQNKPILVNKSAVRYFSTIEQVGNKIISCLDYKGQFSVDECYKISIEDLQKTFSEYHDYWNVKEYVPLKIEKTEEELPLEGMTIVKPPVAFVAKLFSEYYGSKS